MVTCSAEVMGSIPSPDGFSEFYLKKNPVPQWSVAIPLYKEPYGGGALGLAAGLPHY